MIKFLKNEDVVQTRFTVAKQQIFENVLLDLILATDENEETYPLRLPTYGCDNNKSGSCEPILNPNVYLADTSFKDDNEIGFEIGKYINENLVFYPSGSSGWSEDTNPINLNGTYKRQVYNTVKKMHYNDYNNCYNIFGFNNYNQNTAVLNLNNDFSVFYCTPLQAGDTIRPKSIVISNQAGDILSDIYDDGNNNLYLTGSHFINYHEFSSNSTDLVTSNGQYGLSFYLENN